MTQAEKMALARDLAVQALNLPEQKYQIGPATYVIETEQGYVKVAVSAIKGADYDAAEAQAQYEYDRAEAQTKAEKRKAEAEAKKKADVERKAKAKAEKEAKEAKEA